MTVLFRASFFLTLAAALTSVVSAAPAITEIMAANKTTLADADARELATGVLRDLRQYGGSRVLTERSNELLGTMACHAAVKANDPLTCEKMVHILEELRATAYSTVCPHGRPVMLRLTRREIEKNFDRI